MTNNYFGIDFGTTNSIATVVVKNENQEWSATPLLERGRPHPSVIWYKASETIVGQEARNNMDLTSEGTPPGFVRSPKMSLRRDGPIYVDGRAIDPKEAVAEVLSHIKNHAIKSNQKYDIMQAVMTIPVDFGGKERRALRNAASKAGIAITKFVHEPVSALYAYLRAKENLERELAELDGRLVLVFDWGGGTLDLTLCKIQGGSIMQIKNLGDNDIGGDKFDSKLRNLVREKHAKIHGIKDIRAYETPGAAAKLLLICERLKIWFSNSTEIFDVLLPNYLNFEGNGRNLVLEITREEFLEQSKPLIAQGLNRIDEILEIVDLNYNDIELCLSTGGMTNMRAIKDGLNERFLGKVPDLKNKDTIISEGAAWIAKDNLPITLSKPLELLMADTSGFGTYYPLVEPGFQLPSEGRIQVVTNKQLFCTDPRDGFAVVEISKPIKLGQVSNNDRRTPLCLIRTSVVETAKPFIERITCDLQIDHNYIAKITLSSSKKKDTQVKEFHDLDFGLRILKNTNDIINEEDIIKEK